MWEPQQFHRFHQCREVARETAPYFSNENPALDVHVPWRQPERHHKPDNNAIFQQGSMVEFQEHVDIAELAGNMTVEVRTTRPPIFLNPSNTNDGRPFPITL